MSQEDKEKREERALAYKELSLNPAWRMYQVHLEMQWTKKEKEKSSALRVNDTFKAIRLQAEIDGIKFAVSELENQINRLYLPESE